MQKVVNRSSVVINPKLKIPRCMALEKYILKQPSKIVDRRQTVATDVRSKAPERNILEKSSKIVERRQTVVTGNSGTTKKAVPIGARGRKRRTVNLMFIGITPNPNNRILLQPSTSVNGTIGHSSMQPMQLNPQPAIPRSATPRPATTSNPRKTTPEAPTSRQPNSSTPLRSYGKAPSTPFRKLTFSPSPPGNVTEDMPSKDDTTVSFAEICSSPTFGTLRYSSSSTNNED